MSETLKTFKVAIGLCLVCSVVVSAVHVLLKSTQEARAEEFRQQSVLAAAGVWEDGSNPSKMFEDKVEVVTLDLVNGKITEDDPKEAKYDTGKALQDKEFHRELDKSLDVAGLKKIEKFSTVYRVKASSENRGERSIVVMPVRGKGLWSTLWGFVALDVTEIKDGPENVTVAGLTYYKHGETPGLGGEVDNPKWKAMWPETKVFDENWDVLVAVSKTANSDYEVDALSGATLTSNGVTNMLDFWLGEEGFQPYLKSLAGVQTEKEETEETASAPAKPRS